MRGLDNNVWWRRGESNPGPTEADLEGATCVVYALNFGLEAPTDRILFPLPFLNLGRLPISSAAIFAIFVTLLGDPTAEVPESALLN